VLLSYSSNFNQLVLQSLPETFIFENLRMQLLSKQPSSVSFFERQQVAKGPPLPVAKRLETCPTVKSYHPVRASIVLL